MQIPSSLAKEGLFTLLAQFNTKYRLEARQEHSTPQRSKRPRRETAASSSQSSPPPCVASAAEKASKTLASLFSSSDDEEVRLACNFAVLFMQPPYQSNVLNFLGEGDDGKTKSISALQHMLKFDKVKALCALSSRENCVLDEDSLVLKQTVQEIISTLNVWCSNNDAAQAANTLHESHESVETLLTVFCGPPWPEIEIAEPVITAVLRHGNKEVRDQLHILLQEGPCKRMTEWVVGEIPQLFERAADDNDACEHIAELLLSFMQLGVKLEKLMGWTEDTSILAESDVALVRHLLERLAGQLRMDDIYGDLTHNYLRLFCTLVLRSQLSIDMGGSCEEPTTNGSLAVECIQVIRKFAWLHHCPDVKELFESCMKLTVACQSWADPPTVRCERSLSCLTVARDVLLWRRSNEKQNDPWITPGHIMELCSLMMGEKEIQRERGNRLDEQTMEHSIAAFCTLHGRDSHSASKNVVDVKHITDDKDEQLELVQRALELSEMHQSMQDMVDMGDRIEGWQWEDDEPSLHKRGREQQVLQRVEALLESGLRGPLFDSLLPLLRNEAVLKRLEEKFMEENSDAALGLTSCSQPTSPVCKHYTNMKSEGAILLSRILTRVRACFDLKGVASTMLLLESFAASHTLRPFLAHSQPALRMVHVALCSQERDVQLMAMRIYRGLLTDKADPRCPPLPARVNRTNAIKIMFRLMAASPEDKELHECAFAVAYKLTSKCKDVEYTEDEIELLLDSAHKWKEVSIHAPVFGIAMYLSTRPGYKQRLCRLDCVNLVLEAMAEPNQVLVVLQRGHGALRNAARNVMEAGSDPTDFPWQRMAQVTTGLMSKFPEDRELQYRGCGVLVNIASSLPGMIEARDDLDISIVLNAAKRHRMDSELQLWALHFYIQYPDRDMPLPLPEPVGQELVDIMTTHSANDELKTLCMTVLEKLLEQHKTALDGLSDQMWHKKLFWKAWDILNTELVNEKSRGDQGIPDGLVADTLKVLRMFMTKPYLSLAKEWLKDSPEDFTPTALLQQTLVYVEKHHPSTQVWGRDRDAHQDLGQVQKALSKLKWSSSSHRSDSFSGAANGSPLVGARRWGAASP